MSDETRIAVLADVHGNLPALEAALDDIAEQDVTGIVSNGDMVNRGPQNDEVLELLAAAGAEMLLGNHDDLLRMWARRDSALPSSWFGHPFWEGTAWCARQLERSGWLGALEGLPLTKRVEEPGAQRLLIAHGSPRHYREGYRESLPGPVISELGEEYGAEVLVGSHTHIPLRREQGDVLLLNTGAVGTPFNRDPRAHYLLLTLEDGIWRPELRRVAYDRERTFAAFEETGYLREGGLSARIFLTELQVARSLFTPFLAWAEAGEGPLDEEGWREFQRRYPERFEPLPELTPGGRSPR